MLDSELKESERGEIPKKVLPKYQGAGGLRLTKENSLPYAFHTAVETLLVLQYPAQISHVLFIMFPPIVIIHSFIQQIFETLLSLE